MQHISVSRLALRRQNARSSAGSAEMRLSESASQSQVTPLDSRSNCRRLPRPAYSPGLAPITRRRPSARFCQESVRMGRILTPWASGDPLAYRETWWGIGTHTSRQGSWYGALPPPRSSRAAITPMQLQPPELAGNSLSQMTRHMVQQVIVILCDVRRQQPASNTNTQSSSTRSIALSNRPATS